MILQPEKWRPQTQKVRQMRRQRNMFQMKEQDKSPQLNEVERGNLSGKEFRLLIAKIIQDLPKKEWRRKSRGYQRMFNRE